MYLSFIIIAFLFTFLLGSLVLWGATAARVARGEPILEFEPRSPARWGLADVLIAFLMIIGSPAIAMTILATLGWVELGRKERTPDEYFVMLTANAGAILASFVLVWAIIAVRARASVENLGLPRPPGIGRELCLGVAAYVMLAPIVFCVQLILVLIFGPTQHPLILLLQKERDLPLFFAAGASAVIAAPIVEEFLFRGLFQGWMESLRWPIVLEEFMLGRNNRTASVALETPAEPLPDNELSSENPYAPPSAPSETASAKTVSGDDRATWQSWIPITISSALFSLCHWSHGPDFVALFVLALGLGYLFQRTHRLLPCMVVHFLLNGTSMVLMFIQLFVSNGV